MFDPSPADFALARSMIADVEANRGHLAEVLLEQDCRLEPDAALVPVYSHRFLVCSADASDGPVLSISGTDAIVYPRNMEYLNTDLTKQSDWG